MMFDKLIINGEIVTPSGKFQGNIGIKDGKIAAIMLNGETGNADIVIDAKGKLVFPGMIDGHVHFQDPGFTNREDNYTGTMGAALGGITTVVSHPLNNPPVLDIESYEANKEAYVDKAVVDFALHGGASSTSVDKVKRLWTDTGATSIKMFMCFSVAEFPFVQDDTLYQVFEKMSEVDGLCIVHAENDFIINMMEKRLKSEGRVDPLAYNESRPEYCEVEAIRRAAFFAKQTGAKVLIVHISSAAGVMEVYKARQEGVQIWAESCPHFLTFVREDMEKYGPFLKFSPVMRGADNREQMWELLNAGYIDAIGSDHCPFLVEEKEPGRESIWKAPNGIPGIQAMLPTLLEGANKGKITVERIAEVLSYNPARLYGLYPQKGVIQVGSDADLVIVDLNKERVHTKEELVCKAGWSPYIGMTFKGWPETTIVRGEIVADQGQIKVNPGFGQYIPRQK